MSHADLGALIPQLRQLPHRRGGRAIQQPRPQRPESIARSYGHEIRSITHRLAAFMSARIHSIALELGARHDAKETTPVIFTPGARAQAHGYVTVMVPIDSLVGQEGHKPGALRGVAEWIASGRPLEQPLVGLNEQGELNITDGRHRIRWLKEHGFTEVPVSVSKEDADRAREIAAAAQPEQAPAAGASQILRAREIVDSMRTEFLTTTSEDTDRIARRGVEQANAFSRNENGQTARIVRVNPIRTEPGVESALRTAVNENVALIKSIPERYFDRLEQELVDGVNAGRTSDTIASRLSAGFASESDPDGQFAIAGRRADFIARDQTAKLNGSLNEIRQTNIGVTRYRWVTARDERVRGDPTGKYPDAEPSHYARDGEIFDWSDPPEDGHPGAPVNCRCLAEAVLDDILGDLGEEIVPAETSEAV